MADGLEVLIEINTVLFPTEDAPKVEIAIKNIFPEAKLTVEGEHQVQGSSDNLDTFIELLTKQRIRDTAREHLLKNREGDKATIQLNKQIAFVSKIGFSEPGESSLGDIEVDIIMKDWEPLLKLLTPPVLRED
jgi:predicted RNA binding protein with dsRBD fold (UPF0201 family)